MSTPEHKPWVELDSSTREDLDEQFLRELAMWSIPGLTEEGVRKYLEYRHQRPDTAITTYEEGQIRKILSHETDVSRLPDPVEQEEHTDFVERFGAQRLHKTNVQTYVAVMVTLTFAFVVALLILVALI